jgi:rod shape-determining protein MreC
MGKIFLLIRRFATTIIFVILQIFCLAMVFNFNKHHNVIGQNAANNIAGKVHEQQAKIKGFFQLRAEADSIAAINAKLLNQNNNTNLILLDTSIKEVADYFAIDTIGNFKKVVHFVYKPAYVIYNTTNNDKRNYLMLARGKSQGVDNEMAVIGAATNAVVGKVVWANENYSYVMTMFHQKSIIPAKLKKTNENGIVTWDGKNNKQVLMRRIQSTVEIKVGDSIVTSGASDIFPENHLIGTIESFKTDKTTNEHVIVIKTAINYNHINYVQVVENKQQKELRNAVKSAEKELGN